MNRTLSGSGIIGYVGSAGRPYYSDYYNRISWGVLGNLALTLNPNARSVTWRFFLRVGLSGMAYPNGYYYDSHDGQERASYDSYKYFIGFFGATMAIHTGK